MIKAGITGWPLKETLSPVMYKKAFSECNLNGVYDVFPCQNAENIIKEALKNQIQSFNVTIPHKASVIKLLDKISEEARITGSVNAVKYEDGIFKGDNFDIEGFEKSFSSLREISNGNFIIAGCGGSASSIAYSLCRKGASAITISARTPSKAEKLLENISYHFPKVKLDIREWNDFSDQKEECDGIINCSPCGMKGYSIENGVLIPNGINPNCAIFDLVYTPYYTPLIIQAKEKGLKYKNGLEMLVIQGLCSFKYFTGREFDILSMIKYLRGLL